MEKVTGFGNDFARNCITFCAGNSSSTHGDNRKNNLFMLG